MIARPRTGLMQSVRCATGVALLLAGLTACHGPQTPAGLLAQARQYQQRGETRAAIIELKNALQKDPDNAKARALLGALYLETGDALSAEKELRRAQALGMPRADILPSLGKALLMMGQPEKVLDDMGPEPAGAEAAGIMALRAETYLAMGKTEQARQLFQRILARQPDAVEAKRGLARMAISANQLSEAAALVEQALATAPADIDSLRLKGDVLRLQGHTDAAAQAYGQILKLRPDNTHAHIDLANLHLQAGKFAEAGLDIDAARKSAPNNLLVLHAQALLDFRQGKNKAALDAVQRVLAAAPNHMPSVLLMAALQMALGSPQQAEQYLHKFLEANPKNLYASKLLAAVTLATGKPEAVIDIVTPLLQTNPDDVELLTMAGEAQMRARHFGKAAEYFQKASELSPATPALHTALGVSRLGTGDNARALAELERGAALDTKGARAGIMLVMTHLRAKQYEPAQAAVNALEKQQPDNPLVQNLKGGVQLARQDPTAARVSFERAVKLAPAYLPALENLARLDLAEHKPEQARQRFETALRQDPKNTGLMTSLSRLAAMRGDSAEAMRWLERASKENPDALAPAILLSKAYLRTGERQKALVLAQKLQAGNPGNADALALLGQAQLESGDRAAALESSAKLAVLQPDSAPIQLRLATLQIAQNDQAGALQSVKKALSLQPGLLDAQVIEASLLLARGGHAEALALARTIQQQHAGQSAGFMLEGDVLIAQNKPLAAVKLYEQAFGIGQSGPLMIKIHQALTLAGQDAQATTRLNAWLAEHPDDLSTRLYLAGTGLSGKQYKLAIEQYEKIVRQDPNNLIALNNLAWSYQQQKDPRAQATAERAYQLGATSPTILDTLGWILVEKGDTARALPLLHKAAALAPEATEIGYHLGVGLARSGDKRGARAQFEQLLASGKDFPKRAEVQAQLARL